MQPQVDTLLRREQRHQLGREGIPLLDHHALTAREQGAQGRQILRCRQAMHRDLVQNSGQCLFGRHSTYNKGVDAQGPPCPG